MKIEFTSTVEEAVERIAGTFHSKEVISVCIEDVEAQKRRKSLNSLSLLYQADIVQVRFVNNGGFVLFQPKNFKQRKITFSFIAGNLVVEKDEVEYLVDPGPDPF